MQVLARNIVRCAIHPYYKLLLKLRSQLPLLQLLQEELQKWRELNTAEHFLEAAAKLHGITQSLPLLLHHKASLM